MLRFSLLKRTLVTASRARMAGPKLPGLPQNALRKWCWYYEKLDKRVSRIVSPYNVRQRRFSSSSDNPPSSDLEKQGTEENAVARKKF